MGLHRNLLPALVLAAVLGVVTAPRAQAHDRFAVNLAFGGGWCATPAIERRWVPAHYETRIENVLIQAERYEQSWVPPAYETRYDAYGRPYTVCVREGYYQRLLVPAQYQTREVVVWVPGCWVDVPLAAPVCAPSHPVWPRPAPYRPVRSGLSFSFRF
jgi:hypothetical protein